MTMCKLLLPLFALILAMCVFLFAGTAYAVNIEAIAETLTVDDVWLTGDTLHIAVTDRNTGVKQIIELNLLEYASASDEYVTVQAADRNGNVSNSIQFRNPFYSVESDNSRPASVDAIGSGDSPGGSPALTPDGTGTVVDNVTEADGKEFFSISTEDGNVFYLIVDRQRNTDNVYLLNAVTEHDLMSLAKPGDGTVSAVPDIPPEDDIDSEEVLPPDVPGTDDSGTGKGSAIFIILGAIAVGGIGYYFKIVKPKRQAADDDDDGYDEPEDYEDAEDYEERGEDE
jgi:hypothetical protein